QMCIRDRVRTSLNRLRRLGMIYFMGSDNSKFRITEAVFRFGADVRSGDDPREAQLRMIRDGEAMPVESSLSLEDSDDGESSGDNPSVEDEQE
ncbi:chromosome partition protein MukE, partial [Lonsdalea britannica]|uniref:chromosome partition protein MukE n=1 Tax=Lonsdalea britannica TaxID=1082704 RepID=UPI0026EDC41A